MKKRDSIVEDMINQMFIIAGHPEVSYNDVVTRTDDWYTQWTMTTEQNNEWKEWCTKYLSKKKRWSKKIVSMEVAMIDLYCGLKIEDNNK